MDILFWSGGKDAWLALEFYRQHHPDQHLKLLTTYRKTDEIVPHQNIETSHIKKQADHLGLDLLLIPLPGECPNDKYLNEVGKALKKEPNDIGHLIFGDWHLQDIRDWREEAFGEMGYRCLFPIWEKSLHDLLPVITLKPVEITISAVKEEFKKFIRVGEVYNQRFVHQLPEEIDPMGEKGEFHTKVMFKSWNDIELRDQPLY